MKKDEKNLLNVIQEKSPAVSETTTPDAGQRALRASRPVGVVEATEIVLDKEETKKPGFELPDGYLLAQEMKELFEEDIVTHVQGPSEPEAD